MRGSVLALAAGVALGINATAQATWSILIVDTRTGEVGLASATCLTRLDLRELTPVLIAGYGGVTAQSSGDSSGRNRSIIRDRLLEGAPLADILAELAVVDGSGHQTRQYGMIDITGDTLTFSGSGAASWAGGLTGRSGDLAWAVQGNILTGANVASEAAAAIEATPGDLADKLMAAMVAARVNGGDGRCSCDPRTPEGCGSPPPGEFKSADIGYMLIARAEDKDESRVYYFAPSQPGYFSATRLDGDATPDLVVSSLNQTALTTFLNRTQPGDPLSHVGPGTTIETGVTGIKDLLAADLTGDGVDDLVFLGANPAGVHMMPGMGDGGFGAVQSYALSGAPGRLTLGNTDADASPEVAVTVPGAGRVLLLDAADGAWTLLADTEVGGTPTGVAIARLDADAAAEIVVSQRTADTLAVLARDGDAYAVVQTIPVGDEPVDVIAVDFDLDGTNDLVSAEDAGRTLTVLRQAAPGVFEAASVALVADGIDVQAADVTADGLPDLITMAAGNNGIEVFTNQGDGSFVKTHQNRAGAGQTSVLLADISGDGWIDIVSGSFQRGLTLMDNLRDGTFPLYNGFANGDYYMALNVADSISQDPDPVDQLQGLFAEWRQGLVGRIDAVKTEVIAPSRVAPGAAYTVRIEARDWQGLPLDQAVLTAAAFTVSGGGVVTDIRQTEPGRVEIDLAAGTPGMDRTGIRLIDANGPTRLMPDAQVRVLASLADFNSDGVPNFFDVGEFLAVFNAGDTAADLDNNGAFDGADIAAFLAAFLGG